MALVAHYKLNDSLADALGGESLAGTPSYSDSLAALGRAGNFNGVSTRLTRAAFAHITPASPFAFCLWAYVRSVDTLPRFLCYNRVATPTPGPVMLHHVNTTLFLSGYAGAAYVGNRAGTLTVGAWHWICAQFDGASTWELFINNVATGAGTPAHTPGSNGFALGARTTQYYFDGLLDDVRIYDAPLVSAQRGLIYNGGAGNEGIISIVGRKPSMGMSRIGMPSTAL